MTTIHDDDSRQHMQGDVRVTGSRKVALSALALIVGVAALVAAGAAVFERTRGTPLAIPSFLPPPESQPPPCSESIQGVVDAAEPGSTVTVPACVAREMVTIDKPLTLRGEPGAAIRGSDVWVAWSPTGSSWRSADTVPAWEPQGFCADGFACLERAQVFRDGVPLTLGPEPPGPDSFALDDQRHVILGMDPADHLIEVTARTAWVMIDAADVTVTGFDMRHAANAAQTGAILNAPGAGRDTVSENWFAYAHGADVALDHGSGNEIIGNDVGYAGQLGIHLGGGTLPDDGRDNVVRGNRIHHNNLAGFDPEWEAGGLKATVQTGLVVEDNEVDDNAGPGIWCDIYCRDVSIARNRVHHNAYAGIMYEVSSDGRILDNVTWSNGAGKPQWGWGAGILLSSSGTTEVARNISAWNQQAAISVISQKRSDWPDIASTGITVHDNTMAQTDGWLSFWGQDWDGVLFEDRSQNEVLRNRYWPGDPHRGNQFHWDHDVDQLQEFEATSGERDGMLLLEAEINSALNGAGIPVHP